MIQRELSTQLAEALNSMPVVALLGPRQVGKTTLALEMQQLLQKKVHYMDLQSDADLNKLQDAEAYLNRFHNELLILDEVQRKPDLFRILRGLVDSRKRSGEKAGHFLLLGSASRDLLQHSSESLAGRIRFLELRPFTITELMTSASDTFQLERRWLRGGFPDSFLASDELQSWNWRQDFISTYMERDLPSMGVGIAPAMLKRFWKMLAHYHANQVNFSDLGRSLELSHTTTKSYLDILNDFYMVRPLSPWSGNLKKRLVKSPKIYLRDSGILHGLLGISSMDALLSSPFLGASWEGFVVESILNQLDSRWESSYYRTATQVEIDLVLKTPAGEIWAVEVKRNSAPRPGRGFYEACRDIKADRKWIVYAGIDPYPLPDGLEVIGLFDFLAEISRQGNQQNSGASNNG